MLIFMLLRCAVLIGGAAVLQVAAAADSPRPCAGGQEHVARLREAFEKRRCGKTAFEIQVDHVIAVDPPPPLSTPSFESANGPVMEQYGVRLPRTETQLFAGINPWNARGGLDTIATMTRMILGSSAPEEEQPVFESGALTFLSLLLQDETTARARFMCSILREQQNLGLDKFVWNSLLRFLNRLVTGHGQIRQQAFKVCPARSDLVEHALAASMHCPAVASALARFLMDYIMAIDPLDLFNPNTLSESTKFVMAGANPSTILYFSVYPQTASQFGNLVVIFAPARNRSFDLRHFAREGKFKSYFNPPRKKYQPKPTPSIFKGSMLEPVNDAGEILVPAYITGALGFELKTRPKVTYLANKIQQARRINNNNSSIPIDLTGADMALTTVSAAPILTATSFLKADFHNLTFLAVIVPENDTMCMEYVILPPSAPLGTFSVRGFFPCDAPLRESSPLFEVPKPLFGNGSLPVSGLIFRAPERPHEACRVAAAFLSVLNRDSRVVPKLNEQGEAMLRRVATSWDNVYWMGHGHRRCVLGANLGGHRLRHGKQSWYSPPPPSPPAQNNNNNNSSGFLQDNDQMHCQALIPESFVWNSSSEFRLQLDENLKYKAELMGNPGDLLVLRLWKPVQWDCQMICSIVGIIVPVAGQPEACMQAARQLEVGFQGMFTKDAFPVMQKIWPEEASHQHTICKPEPMPAGVVRSSHASSRVVRVVLNHPFVVALHKRVSPSEMTLLENELMRIRVKHIHVVEVNIDSAPLSKVFFFSLELSVGIYWAGRSPKVTESVDYLVCLYSKDASLCDKDEATMLVDVDELAQSQEKLIVKTPWGKTFAGSTVNRLAAGVAFMGVVFFWKLGPTVLCKSAVVSKVKV